MTRKNDLRPRDLGDGVFNYPTIQSHEDMTTRDLAKIMPHLLEVDDGYVLITRRGFDLLLEYSSSFPTGQYDGKIWKAKKGVSPDQFGWMLCEYIDTGDTTMHIKRRAMRVIDDSDN